MSETKYTAGELIKAEELPDVSGGALDMCSPDELRGLIGDLKNNYDTLVDFTSYVIGRIAGETTNGP